MALQSKLPAFGCRFPKKELFSYGIIHVKYLTLFFPFLVIFVCAWKNKPKITLIELLTPPLDY